MKDWAKLDDAAYPAPRRTAVVLRAPSRGKLWVLAISGGAILVAAAAFGFGTGYAYGPARESESPVAVEIPSDPAGARKLQQKLIKQNQQLAAALDKARPDRTYLVVDQTQNRLYVKQDGKVLHEAVCSAGSGIVLKESSGKRTWVFDTPRGRFRVTNRRENPVWKKPDWAFVEEGKPIPRNDADRFEYGTLGEYALNLEDGYMIHGTLYTRLLGRSVTHGCIRLGKDDLRAVWKAAPIGTPVFIY